MKDYNYVLNVTISAVDDREAVVKLNKIQFPNGVFLQDVNDLSEEQDD